MPLTLETAAPPPAIAKRARAPPAPRRLRRPRPADRARPRQQHARRGGRRDRAPVRQPDRGGERRIRRAPAPFRPRDAAALARDAPRHGRRLSRRARDLPTAPRDAIIVTGAEPRAANLRDEPYWDELGLVLDWADANAFSTLHSCLAAHVAVLRSDAVERAPPGGQMLRGVRGRRPRRPRTHRRPRSGLFHAAFALERARRGRARRQGLSGADPLGDLRGRHLHPPVAQPAGLPAGPSRIRRRHARARAPARRATASCAARRRRRACRPAISRPRSPTAVADFVARAAGRDSPRAATIPPPRWRSTPRRGARPACGLRAIG